MKLRRSLLLLLVTALTAWAVQRTVHALAAPASMAGMVPQGALLTIESPDFASLVHDWSASPECKAWLGSDNYSVFSNSRLFGRLNDAETQFFSAAFNNAPDSNALLNQVAGKQSIFAWYDVSNLEFLYITRMPSSQSLQTALVKERTRFQPRQAGGQTFYVRTSKDQPARTVAFATVPSKGGDLLILATREDLMANSLELIAGTAKTSVTDEPWYADATAALRSSGPALHMVLNLDRIVPLAAFRTYWVQGNVTDMKQYRAAVSDLYRDSAQFREERALLLKSPEPGAPAEPDLASLAALAPATGVYRAVATQDPAAGVTAIEEKLLGREHLASAGAQTAPDPTLDPTQAGDLSDYETRIDAAESVSATFSNQALAQALKAAGLDSLLTYSSAQQPGNSVWIPIHNAVVLHGSSAWQPERLTAALQQSLRGTLTAGTLGIDFHSGTVSGHTLYTLSGPKPLFLAITGNTAYLSDDQPLLLTLLNSTEKPSGSTPATLIAGFDHTSQRAPFARVTGLIDNTNSAPGTSTPTTPAFFSRNMRSLSDSFAALQSERIVQRREGVNLRQTVTYQWQH